LFNFKVLYVNLIIKLGYLSFLTNRRNEGFSM
jgi:hypothetical protein